MMGYLLFQVKEEGYDGKEASVGDDGEPEDEPSQWSISGALLYSVTIITTIGKKLKTTILHHIIFFKNPEEK